MIRNYFTIALRNIMKNKLFSAINICGLGIGLLACLLIFQFVTFQLSYDKFNEKFERLESAGLALGRSFEIRTADAPADQKYTLSNYGVDQGCYLRYRSC